ncbi:MAG: tetratricopeptide repeat protein [Calditrichaeota bacterium]|nr:MAG: tetratricopeptide repeat protein [Calditrichota bacterium]
MKRIIATLMLLSLTIALISCGGGEKVREARSEVDTPEVHYDRGKALLGQEKFNDAMFEFKQATSLNPKFAPAYEGMAWIYLEQNDLKAAEEAVNKALDLDGKWVLAKIARARIKAKQEKYDDAIDEAKDAIKDIPGSSVPDKRAAQIEAWLTLGDIYKEADRYDEAQKAYQQVLEIDRLNMKASKAIKDLAAYKTATTGQRPELKKIASKKEITRSDVAVLFVLELPLEKIFRQAPQTQEQSAWRPPTQSVMGKREPESAGPALPPDVPEDHWAKSFIVEALEKGAMETYPDGTFHPDEKVNRGEFARIIEKFLMRYWNDPKLETRYFGSTSPFADVNSTSPIFNSIMVVSTRNIMPGFDDGTFRPLKGVNGTEALNIIRKLKAEL